MAVEATVKPEAAEADYAQFAQRNLDKLSWLYPLVNNKLGALLHLQLLLHHALKGEGTSVDVGYGIPGHLFGVMLAAYGLINQACVPGSFTPGRFSHSRSSWPTAKKPISPPDDSATCRAYCRKLLYNS